MKDRSQIQKLHDLRCYVISKIADIQESLTDDDEHTIVLAMDRQDSSLLAFYFAPGHYMAWSFILNIDTGHMRFIARDMELLLRHARKKYSTISPEG